MLDIVEQRHHWAEMVFTPKPFKDILTNLLPKVIIHSQSQDKEQVCDHYDRGDDFCPWFLGPCTIYTSGIVTNLEEAESLEQLQDNNTLAAFATKICDCGVTGITLGKNQTKFGNDRIKNNKITPDKARILCMDYHEIPSGPSHFTKIMYDLLDDDGIFVLLVAGTRLSWQYEDLIWGLFLNEYIYFPGADASCSLS
ncbi:hypothetical protein JVU11DRAFT_11073 [Chiua virens]|nr:hypothetical protein JVU11DRAFT_11073 [Chiua virens]